MQGFPPDKKLLEIWDLDTPNPGNRESPAPSSSCYYLCYYYWEVSRNYGNPQFIIYFIIFIFFLRLSSSQGDITSIPELADYVKVFK